MPEPTDQQIRDQEAVRITVIQARRMLLDIRDRIPNAKPEGVDPHCMWESWLQLAEMHLASIAKEIVIHKF